MPPSGPKTRAAAQHPLLAPLPGRESLVSSVLLFLVANIVTTSKAPVTRSDALVTSSVLAPSSKARSAPSSDGLQPTCHGGAPNGVRASVQVESVRWVGDGIFLAATGEGKADRKADDQPLTSSS